MGLDAVLRRGGPRRFIVRTTIATLAMVATVLTAVFAGVAYTVRERVRSAVGEKLEAGQRTLAELEQRRARELSVQVAALAENANLKAAVATYLIETRTPGSPYRHGMLAAIERELSALASRTSLDVLAATDPSGTVLAVAGRRNQDWPRLSRVLAKNTGSGSSYVARPAGVFQFASATLTMRGTTVGTLQLGKALDSRYARELSTLSGAATVIASRDRVLASTLPAALVPHLTPAKLSELSTRNIVTLAGDEYAAKLLFQDGEAQVYALDSVGASTRVPMQQALRAMAIFAICSFALAAVASFWLARTISRPIDTLSKSLSEMTKTRDFDHPVAPTGSILEVDALTAAFNTMMASVSIAESERQSAYLGAIKALAMALDARDPYTAGHSERVSIVSVAIGRHLDLPEDQLEILRLGALLHDIGKIGISDAVLRKPGTLTPEEYETIREHPSLGARILRSVPFLAPHIPIVELHHERPDGLGYPYGLKGHAIPMLARIVHVADAFDAITSARAYRQARPASQAVRELSKHSGTQFDADIIQALITTLPTVTLPAQTDIPIPVRPKRRLAIVTRTPVRSGLTN
ncbi:MAG TPA: HD domain-containing phosphohydrolase [Vicinamibacterales bacterium]|nr:HD domain-containing phosphohydrolase [Vicinamibacterales bacterium]